jgi:hypothetical protein
MTMPKLRASKRRFGSVPLLFIISILCVGQAPVPEPVTDQETELGQEMYKDLRNKGEIFRVFSPLSPRERSGFLVLVQ